MNFLEKEFLEAGNPFEPGCTELINAVTNDVMDDDVVNSVRIMENLGNKQNTAFFNMLKHDPTSFNNPVKNNKLPLMNKSLNKKTTKSRNKRALSSFLRIMCCSSKFEVEIWMI